MDKVWKRLKIWCGLDNKSEYVKAYFERTNLKASIYMSVLVLVLEFYMIYFMVGRATERGKDYVWLVRHIENYSLLISLAYIVLGFAILHLHGPKPAGNQIRICTVICLIELVTPIYMFWFNAKYILLDGGTFASYLRANLRYITLLLLGISLLLYALQFRSEKPPTPRARILLGNFYLVFFSGICIWFGITISRDDFQKGNQILCFITMILFATCLLIWRPIISFVTVSGTFLYFYHLCLPTAVEMNAVDSFRINFMTLWITIVTISTALYYQRQSEAEKDEGMEEANAHLKYLTVTDELTGLSNARNFYVKAREILNDAQDPSEYLYLFLNIENFGNYNQRYGYGEGNELLKKIGALLTESFAEGGLVARQSDDHYLVLTTRNRRTELDRIQQTVRDLQKEVRLELKAGGYSPASAEEGSIGPCDKARRACSLIRNRYDENYLEYDSKLDDRITLRKYIINNIDNAIEKGYVRPYYQPVVWAKDGTLCGYEALARWIDPEYGFLSPGDFIPVLEEYRLIHKLDCCIVEQVCRDLSDALQSGFPCQPVSLNFSRIDFEMMDVPAVLDHAIKKYNIDKDMIHVEVTESALAEHDNVLQEICDSLRNAGYSLWLDDFGSGYSALSALKDYSFEVMKIDMKFLSTFETNPKSRAIIRSIVQMASTIKMKTLTEGVETAEQAEFLKDCGCERLQGYYFGKPMKKEEVIEKYS